MAFAPIAVSAQPAGIDPAWFAGTWSDNANCSVRVQFLADGRYLAPGGAAARWRIERGNVLVLEGPRGRQDITIERVNDRQVRTVPEGINSYRCQGGPSGGAFAPTAAQVSGVTRDWLLGAWSDNRDCSARFEFRGDGTFTVPNGGGSWTLARNRVTLTAGSNQRVMEIARIGQDELRLVETGVSSWRCR